MLGGPMWQCNGGEARAEGRSRAELGREWSKNRELERAREQRESRERESCHQVGDNHRETCLRLKPSHCLI